jgi:hypothetical protein
MMKAQTLALAPVKNVTALVLVRTKTMEATTSATVHQIVIAMKETVMELEHAIF